MGAYSRWALIRGLALIRINTVFQYFVILPTCRNVNVDTDKAFLFVGCCSFFLGTKSLQVVETNGENRRPRYGAC